ncbi:MAG: hypothetical protein HQ541_02335 [Mariniphaga sp.]|nr:hypothetical protein [Mariniphaga sp.]
MLTDELKDKIKETLAICTIHHQRMMFAYNSIIKYFPLTESNFVQLSDIELALFDLLIYRFSKLQNSMGSRMFKQLLDALEEDISGLPFIDILYKMEKLNLITSAKRDCRVRNMV